MLPFSFAGLGNLAASLFGSTRPSLPPTPAARPLGRAMGGAKRGRRQVHARDAGTEAGARFLHTRRLHPGASSSIRKLQRAFRIAGRSFTPGRGL